MKTNIITAAFLATLAAPASAVITIDYVTVGNAGNAADSLTGRGGVSYAYNIAKNETTIAQYAEFLNAVAKTDSYGLYYDSMATTSISGISKSGSPGSFTYSVSPGSGNRPITYVSWFDAARFCNWLHNGQQTGAGAALTAETGAYTLNGATSGIITRNVGATVWIPTENEWYKAAYYDPTKSGGTGGYWLHANQSDSMTTNDMGTAGAANFYDGNFAMDQNALSSIFTEVGSYGADSASYYGTNDQGGNVYEWNDTVFYSDSRGMRGGDAGNFEDGLRSTNYTTFAPTFQDASFGFRLAAAIPEPTTGLLAALGLFPMLSRRRKA